jgi:hypothetical protein
MDENCERQDLLAKFSEFNRSMRVAISVSPRIEPERLPELFGCTNESGVWLLWSVCDG